MPVTPKNYSPCTDAAVLSHAVVKKLDRIHTIDQSVPLTCHVKQKIHFWCMCGWVDTDLTGERSFGRIFYSLHDRDND